MLFYAITNTSLHLFGLEMGNRTGEIIKIIKFSYFVTDEIKTLYMQSEINPFTCLDCEGVFGRVKLQK